MSTIDCALTCAKKGYDGIIHVKSFGCTPENDAIPVLQNISRDYKIPVLYLSFDLQTGEEGLSTRLEAFYDMVVMRKRGRELKAPGRRSENSKDGKGPGRMSGFPGQGCPKERTPSRGVFLKSPVGAGTEDPPRNGRDREKRRRQSGEKK